VKIIARIAVIVAVILLALVALALLVFLPPDRVERDPSFPQITGPYLSQPPPGRTPERFAPGIIHEDVHTAAVFSPDGKEVYWRTLDEETVNDVLFMRWEDGTWTPPQVAPFASRFFDSDDPCFSPDGEKLFFTSWRPVRWYKLFNLTEGIWYVEKTARGWSRPREVGPAINSMDLHWQLSVSENGSLYFASGGDIYRSAFEGGQYQEPNRLGDGVNTPSDDGHPFIAPDESYLLFSSNGYPDSVGDYDLFVSVREADGSWSQAVNLGKGLNSPHQDLYPVVSPDQKYLFFVSSREGMHSIYWVDFGPVKSLISEQSEGN